MPFARLAACSLAALALLAAPDPVDAHDPSCFAAAPRDTITLHGPQLQAMSDALVRAVSNQPGTTNDTTYLLMRQSLLIERIQRGVESHSETTCGVALDRIRRDFDMLRTTWKAFALGDTTLEIARLESKSAQDLLTDIENAMQPVAEAVAALAVVQDGS